MSTSIRDAHKALAKKGLAMRRRVHPAGHVERVQNEADRFMMMFHNTTNEFCWGTVWSRPGLGIKERSALSLAMAAANGQTGAIEMHTKTALKAGWTRRQIGEIFLHVYVYAGVYASLNAFLTARRVFDEIDRAGAATPRIGRAAKPRRRRRAAAR
ncbi:MAG: carboxymuconolactone decarboxylase family protein [Proteobacteria bacterium]|nr:carboxymuconolactone decarboxylase family protein [Pseudomonadota bacterium]